ncbi:MAG: extensin family protein [Candidatus Devosia symbiotica]|nr:extensin family protein [Candidatus Devosia symbiotica]
MRNNQPTERVSEHDMANVLDVSGFELADGRTIAVKMDWLPGNVLAGRLLQLAHDATCGLFTTVRGLETNADHDDHIHLDLGCHGQSCTAQICE